MLSSWKNQTTMTKSTTRLSSQSRLVTCFCVGHAIGSRIPCHGVHSCKGELINMTRAWDKEKFWVPDRNRTHDLPNTRRALYPLSYENSWRARSFNWVHLWQVSCRSTLLFTEDYVTDAFQLFLCLMCYFQSPCLRCSVYSFLMQIKSWRKGRTAKCTVIMQIRLWLKSTEM